MNTYASLSNKFDVSGLSWVIFDSIKTLIDVSFKRWRMTWKIKVLKIKAIKAGLNSLLSKFDALIAHLLIKSDLSEMVASLLYIVTLLRLKVCLRGL